MNTFRMQWASLLCGFLVAAIVFSPVITGAKDKDKDKHRIPSVSIPTAGIPYSSVMGDDDDGDDVDIFSGAIQIDRFEVKHGELKAIGTLLGRGRSHKTTFSVEVVQANCDLLHLEIGPPKHPRSIRKLDLQTPLILVESLPGSELRRADFCAIAQAFVDDDLYLLADELNEREKVDAGVISSCPWWKQIECAFAVTSCRAICTLFTPFSEPCRDCFNALGQGGCISCYVP